MTVQNLYTGDGTTVLFPFSFPYLETDHVKVEVNGSLTTAFTLANPTTVQFNSAPANGAAIKIFRQTPSNTAEATIFAGSAIRASDLNRNTTQLLYISQETEQSSDDANVTANAAATAAASAVQTALTADSKADQAILDSQAAVNTANAASSAAGAAVSTANGAVVTANAATNTANAAANTAAGAVNTANNASSTAGVALSTANAAAGDASAAVSTANSAASDASTALSTANLASSNASIAVNTANAASSTAVAASNTANSALSAANGAVNTANAAAGDASNALSTANQASLDAAQAISDSGAAVSTANAAAGDAAVAISTANAAAGDASAAVITANAASAVATQAAIDADDAVDTATVARNTADAAIAAVANAVAYTPVANLTALLNLSPAPVDGSFYELVDSTGADTSADITGVPGGLVGDPGLTFRLRYDDPPGEFVFLGYFSNDPETRYAEIATEGVAAGAASDAAQALLDAAAAQGDASQAILDAAAAQGDATQALSDAAAAQGDATQALSDAAAAQGDATQALSDAAAAQSTANAAMPLAGGTFTGDVTFAGTQSFPGVLALAGGTMTGAITFAGGQSFPGVLPLGGGTMTGNITFAGGQSFPVSGIQAASTSQVGVVQLNNTISSTSTTQAATANAAKLANDNANTRALKSGDTFTGSVTFPDGSLSAPGVRFSGASNTGFIRTAGGDVSVVRLGSEVAKFKEKGEIVLFGSGNNNTFIEFDRTDTSGGGTASKFNVSIGGGGNLLIRDSLASDQSVAVFNRTADGEAGLFSTYNARVSGVQASFGARCMLKYNGSANSLVYARRVNSVTKNGTGDYTVNMQDGRGGVDYTIVGMSRVNSSEKTYIGHTLNVDQVTGSFRLNVSNNTGTILDSNQVHIAVFDG
jgi:hypothetical protein